MRTPEQAAYIARLFPGVAEAPRSYYNHVPFDGDPWARILYCGEAPGREEDYELRGFVGKSGQLLWQMSFKYASIDRSDVVCANLVTHRTDDDNRDPTPEEIVRDCWELMAQVDQQRPAFVVTLGKFSTGFFLGDMTATMEYHNAIPREIECQWNPNLRLILCPVVHPAAGLHNAEFLKQTSTGLQELGRVKQGLMAERPTQPPLSRRNYRYVTYPEDIPDLPRLIAIDTEGSAERPYSLQVSAEPGDAFIILASNYDCLEALANLILYQVETVVIHTATGDLKTLKAMGIDLIGLGCQIHDTILDAYHLQTEPKGLKPLAWRHCGMEMRDYLEVVTPHLTRARERWAVTTYEALAPVLFETPPPKLTKKGVPVKRKNPPKEVLLPGLPEDIVSAVKKLGNIQRDLFAGKSVNVESRLKPVLGTLAAWGHADFPQTEYALSFVPDEEFIPYACADADGDLQLYHALQPKLEALGLQRVSALDHACLPMLNRMEERGMLLDVERVRHLEMDLQARVEALEAKIQEMAPGLNPSSPAQVADWLFESPAGPQLPAHRMTKKKTRFATNEEALQELVGRHPIIPLLLEHRGYSKLLNTFIQPLYELRNPKTGRIHPRINYFSVVSGRYATNEPNLLAFPAHTEDGKRVRSCFITQRGWKLLSVDFSQIELVVMAVLAKDPVMCASFQKGEDLHRRTASIMFQAPYESISKEDHRRFVAKTLNFAILFGITAEGLFKQFVVAGLPYTLEDCQRLIEEWFQTFPAIRKYIAEIHDFVMRHGYIVGITGRRRYLPAAQLVGQRYPFAYLREEALRQAVNFVIQEGAQSLSKEAMADINNYVLPEIRKCGIMIEPLLQIHDELLFEAEVGEQDSDAAILVQTMILEAMEAVGRGKGWGAPVKASAGWGDDWGQLK